jgi:hypothetical protein
VAYFAAFRAPIPPDVVHAELQMPWPRLAFEIKKRVGLGGRAWDPERPWGDASPGEGPDS